MNLSGIHPGRLIPTFLRAVVLLGLLSHAASAAEPAAPHEKEYQPAPGEFDAVGQAIVTLLQTKDAPRFATNFMASAADFHSLLATNPSAQDVATEQQLEAHNDTRYRQLLAEAKTVLHRADALGLDFSQGGLQAQGVTPAHFGRISWLRNQANGHRPWVQTLEIILKVSGWSNPPAGGDFKLAVGGLAKFPGGWHIVNGLQWSGFPTNVADPKLLRTLLLQQKMANNQGFSAEDDPALQAMADTLVRFIRERDPGILAKELLVSSDLVWSQIEQRGGHGPSRKELDEAVTEQNQRQLQMAQAAVKLMEDAGVDLKLADISVISATVGQAHQSGPSDSLDQTRAS